MQNKGEKNEKIRTRILDIVLPDVQYFIKKGYTQDEALRHLTDILCMYYDEEYFKEWGDKYGNKMLWWNIRIWRGG